jgi:membrane protease YdiL (CAAX protease family)
MLLLEKWISSGFYPPIFALCAPATLTDEAADAWFRLLCGVGLLAIVLVASRFSRPAAAFVRARVSGRSAVVGIGAAGLAIGAAGALLALVARGFGSGLGLAPPHTEGPLPVVLFGQALIALAEEAYYRGLLLGEILRLAPRLGPRSPSVRRWVALASTSMMFGMEHMGVSAGWDDAARRFVFALALGILLGLLVLLTDNLWFAAAMHAWINGIVLGAVPRLAFGHASAGLPVGASVSLAMIGAFVAAFIMQRRAAAR